MNCLPNHRGRASGARLLLTAGKTATLLAVLAMTGPVYAQTESPQSALDRLLPACISCHGPNGVSTMNDIPALAGQHEDYLYDSLKEFRGQGGSSELMRSMLAALSDRELRTLANHFASQPYVRSKQTVNAEKVARGREVYQNLCVICHSDRGRSSAYPEYPLLAGQNLDYMRNTMLNILSRGRTVDIMKREMLALVSPEKVDDAIHFLAAQEVLPSEVRTHVRMAPRVTRRQIR